MGLLENGDRRCVLGPDQLVGREPSAALRMDDESISWRHASVRWTGIAWELQDLGSRNGTFLDGQRVAAGTRVFLRPGARVRFGEAGDVWRLTDGSPPVTSVVDLATGERLLAFDELIALPSSDEPSLFLSRQADGEWIAELDARVWHPQPREVLTVSGQSFRFEPAEPVYATRAGGALELTVGGIGLSFWHSQNEECVEVVVLHGLRRIVLRQRAHSYLLLTLARQRVRDQREGVLADAEQGWIYQDELLKMLNASAPQLAVNIYRARKQFSDAGIGDAAQIIERRATTQELRLGVSKLEIRSPE